METENVEIIKAMVANGVGISIIPYPAVARDVRSGPLRLRRIGDSGSSAKPAGST